MKKTYARLMLAVLVFLPVLRVTASEITLKNGDRISGTIVELTETSLVLETDYAGRIAIDRGQIDNIIEPAVDSGASLSGPSPVDEPPPLPPASERRAAAAKKAAPPPLPKARLFEGPMLGLADGWQGSGNVGFSVTSGNSNNTTMTTGVSAVKHGVDDTLSVYARSLWNSTHRSGKMITTQNAFWGGARYNRNVDRGVFGFVSYDFESDQPNRLNFRSVVGSGVGHHSVKNERTEIDLLAGGAWNRTWQAGDDSDTPEGLAGATLKHKFNDRLRLEKAFTWFQNVADSSEYRYILDATLTVDVTKRIGFYFSAGDRFNNDPLGNAKRNDFLFTTGMKWSFGKKK